MPRPLVSPVNVCDPNGWVARERRRGLPVETHHGQLCGQQAAGLTLVHALGGLYLAVVKGSADFAACKLLTQASPPAPAPPPPAPCKPASLVAGETAWKCRPIASGKRVQAQALQHVPLCRDRSSDAGLNACPSPF